MRLYGPVLALAASTAIAACGGGGSGGGGTGAGSSSSSGASTSSSGGTGGGATSSGSSSGGAGGTSTSSSSGTGGGATSSGNTSSGSSASASSSSSSASSSSSSGGSTACDSFTIDPTMAAITNDTTGTLPAPSTFTGGSIESGTYVLTSVHHYGSHYGGYPQETLIIDSAAMTLAEGGTYAPTLPVTNWGYDYTFPAANTLQGNPACPGSPLQGWYYTFAGSGSGATLTWNSVGSSDVEVFTKQ